ncbi:MAG: class I SAM-dependent RNA methyltransferase [Sedimentisphaerales bacterium]|nr:class I SAM-dependent RNA methyltransferase [Sedimentisphaerales bacterium]
MTKSKHSQNKDPGRILVICAPGLSSLLADELRGLGYKPIVCREKGVELAGDMADALKLNMHLRTGLYVLFLLKEFRCDNADELYRHASEIEWERIIPQDGYVSIVSRVDNPSINNTMYPNLKLKDAIVDRMQLKCGARPDSGPDKHRVVVNLYWQGNKTWIYLNTSGNKLSDRGYRKLPHKAPLQETLAAGIVLSSEYDGSQPLVLPMCGSGTLAIEAALIALNRPGGLLRTNYSFMHTVDYDKKVWDDLRYAARKASRKELAAPIIATDIDPQAVEAAKKNALTAGVEHLIDFDVCDFAETTIPDMPGIVILNPEYGQRMGEIAALEKTYGRIGDFFKQRCAGYTGYIFTGNMDLAKKVGLRTSRKIPFYNGSIECRLLRYEMYTGTRKAKYNNDAE